MSFVNVDGTLINLNLVANISLSGSGRLVLSYGNGTHSQFEYATLDKAQIAFSQLKMQIDKMQGGVK